jgi:hypothetical protein
MNNEPVAWMCPTGLEYKQRATDFMYNDALYDTKLNWIPLYTHPVKELTDEVKDTLMDVLSGWKYIRECHGDLYGVGWDRVEEKLEAILRKAQEK